MPKFQGDNIPRDRGDTQSVSPREEDTGDWGLCAGQRSGGTLIDS